MPYNERSELGQSFLMSRIFRQRGFFSRIDCKACPRNCPRNFYNNRSQLNLCVGICYSAMLVGGINPLLNAGCVACIGVGGAILEDKVSSCIDEANQTPDTCGKCR